MAARFLLACVFRELVILMRLFLVSISASLHVQCQIHVVMSLHAHFPKISGINEASI